MFGGTFDPVHRGHLQVARAALAYLGADHIVFIPAAQSPHKQKPPVASGKERAEMIARALSDQPGVSVSDCELHRPRPSYTLDTVLYFRNQLGPEVALFWLVGADAVSDLPRWHRVDELLDAADIAVMYRAGYPKPDFGECRSAFSAPQIERLRKNVVPVPLIDISSTEIRRRLAAGKEVAHMLPPDVHAYIQSHRLYRPGD